MRFLPLIMSIISLMAAISCGPGEESSNPQNPSVVAATVDLDEDLSDWGGLTPLIDDAGGDASAADTTDIRKAYMAFNDDYFYFRIDLADDVKADWFSQLYLRYVFFDDENEQELTISVGFGVGIIEIELLDTNDNHHCGLASNVLTLPLENHTTYYNDTVLFRLPKQLIDWDFDGTLLHVESSDADGQDTTEAVRVTCSDDHLETVSTTWNLPPENPEKRIPWADVMIDGEFDDWAAIAPIFIDPADDFEGLSYFNILSAGMVQDAEAYFFQVHFQLPVPAYLDPNDPPQVRFEIMDNETGEERWMTVWFNYDQVQIQDPSLLDLSADEDESVLVTYQGIGNLAIDGNDLEFRILKADLDGFALSPGCAQVVTLGMGAGDRTDSVYVTDLLP